MAKNTIIGLLILVVIVGLGFYLSNNNKEVAIDGNPPVSNSTTKEPASTVAPINTPGSPTVETSQNTGVSNSTASLTGHVNPNGSATTYWFDYGETTAFGARNVAQAIGSGSSSISTPGFITGLHANTVYYYRLSAKNNFSTVNGATYSFQTNNTPAPIGSAPTTSTSVATNVYRTTANVNGEINPNNFPSTYWFEYGTDGNLGFVTALQSTNAGTTQMPVSISVSGLEPLTKYSFRLNAQNQYGTVNGAIMSFTTSGPRSASSPTVTTNNATNIASTGAKLVGRINPNGDETTYWFEYSDDSLLGNIIGSGTPKQILDAGTNTISVQANINGLSPNARYYYRLVGQNQYGTVLGDIVSFTTKK